MSITSVEELISYLNNGGEAKYMYFWGHTQKGAEVDHSCLSQWFPAQFEHTSKVFLTAEHFMMHGKALLFGDMEIAHRILSAKTPGEAKALGRKVSNFDEAVWLEHRWGLVVTGNVSKFSQNDSLRRFLLNTSSRILVEASPVDAIWGIGLDKAEAMNLHPSQWKGQNLLGFALMEVRDKLLAGSAGDDA